MLYYLYMSKKILRILKKGVGACLVGLLLVCSACSGAGHLTEVKETRLPNFEAAKVDRVIDGDTIQVTLEGGQEKERVRLIGVDTPETKHPQKPVEYFGQEASAFTTSLIEGEKVYLEKDVSDRDRYQRLLRYVWLDQPTHKPVSDREIENLCVNAILLKKGFAKIATFPPDVHYTDRFVELERKARENKAGLWQQDKSPGVHLEQEQAPVAASADKPESGADPNHSTAENRSKLIKGNRSSKIYHLPGGRHYDSVKESNAVYFATESEAEAAGYRAAKQ